MRAEADRRYAQSEKGRARKARYEQTEKGRAEKSRRLARRVMPFGIYLGMAPTIETATELNDMGRAFSASQKGQE